MGEISHKFESDEKLIAMQDQLKNAMLMLPLMLEYAQVEAELKRGKYLAFLSKGFTEAQALELCKAV